MELTEKLLRKREVLRILPISSKTLARRRWDGSIKALRVNSKLFVYPESSILEFLSKLRSGELETTTFEGPDQPRPLLSEKKRQPELRSESPPPAGQKKHAELRDLKRSGKSARP